MSVQIAHIAASVVGAVKCGAAALMNFVRHPYVIQAAQQVQLSESWMSPCGSLLAAGAAGLLAGLVWPPVGAAAIGLVVYFVVALGAHLRVGDRHLTGALVFLCVAVAALVLGALHHRGV